MDRECNAFKNPRPAHMLFRESAKDVPPLLHDALGRLHLLFKSRIVRTDAVAVRRLGQKNYITLFDLEPRRRFFGEDKTNRVADLHELKRNHSRTPMY